ncbi:MAG: AmmeMemoRadiSam system radical SAM enzyme [Candidatus Scalindua sp.]|nr:MAG: AmmeMemoRadiSam system radical SAM enzyme [Candidatus Scalindua sp.]
MRIIEEGDMISRRELIKSGAIAACSVCTGYVPFSSVLNASGIYDEEEFPAKEAMYYKQLPEERVECELCPRGCKVADLERGYCGVRENRGGKYYTLVHSRVCALNVDPIEKKPLFHYLPGRRAYSLATAGCNIECKFCQNWQISQFRPEQLNNIKLSPGDVVRGAKAEKCEVIAFTYSEPVIFYEYVYDTARSARKAGVKSVMISNGYIEEEPLIKLCKELDAVKIDFKAFTEKFYKETCSGELKPVLDTLLRLRDHGIWFEVVMLVVPTLNDSPEELKAMCSWIKMNLGTDVPIHFTRFHPTYKIKNLPPTPIKTLERARNIAIESGLNFAYIGNLPGHPGENTYCPGCKEMVIRRAGHTILQNSIQGGECGNCNHPIPGVWG